MKILLTGLCLLACTILFSQTGNLIGKNYVTKADIKVSLYNYTTNKIIEGGEKIFSRGSKFYVVDINDSNNLIIKQWSYKKGATGKKGTTGRTGKTEDTISKTEIVNPGGENAYAREESNNQFFIMDLKQFNDKCDPFNARDFDFTIGVMTIPIKLRGGNGDNRYFEFEEKFNMGISAGFKMDFNSKKSRSLSALFNVSVSSARLDSLNTGGYQHTSSSSTSVTLAVGLLYQQDNTHVGIFLGWDKIPGVAGKSWQYNGLPWVGIGIGIALFSLDLDGNKEGMNK